MQLEDDPDIAWVAQLAGVSEDRARSAVHEATSDRALFRHLERKHRLGGRESYIEIDAPLELHAIARLVRPEHVVEVGVSSGVSSAYLLAALERNGRGTLHSVDLPREPKRPEKSGGSSWSIPAGMFSGWAVPPRLRARWDLRLGDKAHVIPRIADELRRVDMVVYDVPHNEADLAREFALLDPRMPAGGVAISDHGPGGGLCAPLGRWAITRSARAVGRSGLGLYGFRCSNGARRGRSDGRSPTRRRAVAFT